MERLRKLTEADLTLLLTWRNTPSINRYMFNQNTIKISEHTQWFRRAIEDPTQTLLIFEQQAKPVGYMNYTQRSKGAIAEWGFYVAPDAAKGTGTKMTQCALQYAFEEIKLQKIYAQVLAYNEASIKLHNNLGFQNEGILRKQHFDGMSYHDIYCFGLFADEWQQTQGNH
ncbi:UDP-4-amino-4,6-dideoxy-N-acetyl-beta-L-altrosamine N-acetyltransferase [Pseudomonas sp. abacavir_1]